MRIAVVGALAPILGNQAVTGGRFRREKIVR